MSEARPNLTMEQIATTRAEVAGKILAARESLAKLVDRDHAAEERLAEIDRELAASVETRAILVAVVDSVLAGEDGPPLEEAIAQLNAVDFALEVVRRAKRRADSEIGTARAEREKAKGHLDELRARLAKLVEP